MGRCTAGRDVGGHAGGRSKAGDRAAGRRGWADGGSGGWGGCGFATNITVTKGKFGGVGFDTGAIITSPGLEAMITNTENGEFVSLDIQGVFHDTYLPDGTIDTIGTGKNLLFGLLDGEPGMLAIDGKFEMSILPDGTFTGLSVDGRVTDVCELLT